MRVLLVISDNGAVRDSVCNACAADDVLLCEATTGAAARRLVSLKVDIVIADTGNGGGEALVSDVKALAPEAPLLVLCDRLDPAAQAVLTRAGAAVCLAKPFDVACLREEIDRITAPTAPAACTAETAAPVAAPPQTVGQHQMALRWISRASQHGDDPEGLCRRLADFGADIFDTVRCVVLLEGEGGVRVAASTGLPPAVTDSLLLSYRAGLMHWFDIHGCLAQENLLAADAQALKEWRLLHAKLGAPLFREGQVFGALLLGEKASAPVYSAEERELLTLVARCVAMLIAQAEQHTVVLQRQRRLDTVLSHINAGVITVTPAKTVAMMNQSAERLLGTRAVEIIGRNVHHLSVPLAEVIMRTLDDGVPRLRQEIRDSELDTPLGLSATPMGNDGVVAVFWAMPAAQHSELTAAAEQRAAAQLAARIAQEVKNPMVAISTFAQLLPAKYDAPDFRNNFSHVVQREVSRVNRVVEMLFEFAEEPRLTLEPGDVNATVRNVLESFASELTERRIELSLECAPGPAMVEVDGIFFAQALHNVVRNAIDAMPGGGALRVSTHLADVHAEVRVADTGHGIAPDKVNRLFEPFFSTRETGMGLGLTVAARILAGHGGALSLSETGDHGTCFAFRIPTSGASHAHNTSH